MIIANLDGRCIKPSDTLKTALLTIANLPEQRTAFVVDEKGLFLGLITEGDIRRALIAGAMITDFVDKFYNNNPVIYENKVKHNYSDGNRVYPVLQKGILIGYYCHNFSFKLLNIKTLIMAGGFGKRLRPLTDHEPKPMIDVGGKPILQLIIEELHAQGLSSFILSTHYLPHVIKDFFGNGSKLGVGINYIHESQPLGTGGSITLINEDVNLLVTNGDILTKLNYQKLCEYHFENNFDVTICVRDYSLQIPYGVVTGNTLVESVVEKPSVQSLINSGIYVFSANVVKELRKAEIPFDIPSKINELIESGFRVGKYHFDEFWLDVGVPSELDKARNIFEVK